MDSSVKIEKIDSDYGGTVQLVIPKKGWVNIDEIIPNCEAVEFDHQVMVRIIGKEYPLQITNKEVVYKRLRLRVPVSEVLYYLEHGKKYVHVPKHKPNQNARAIEKGIYERNDRYKVQLTIKGEPHYLGCFDTKEEAREIRDNYLKKVGLYENDEI
jgi:hypothetical protein